MYLFYLTLKTPNSLMAVGIMVYTIMLSILCPILQKKNKYTIVRILCVLPFVTVLVHFGIYSNAFLVNYADDVFKNFFLLYAEALISLGFLFCIKSVGLRVLRSVITILLVPVICFMFVLNSIAAPYLHDYTRYNYTESFTKMLNAMGREYCLNSWKQIDYEGLLNKYLPMVEEAEHNKDEAAYAAVVSELVYRFYDSHVAIDISGTMEINYMFQNMAGNDYGLSLIRVDDKSVIAICVEPECEAEKLGIHNGTTIVAWDNKEINEAISCVECIMPPLRFPVKENEDVFRPIFLAGKGGDIIDISFIDDDGNEKTVSVHKMDSYKNRQNYVCRALLNKDMEMRNFYTCMVDDKCGYLQIERELYDTVLDNVSVVRHGYYPKLTERYAKCIEQLKNQGMEYLIIDIRNNGGGYDSVAGALASLFTEEKRHMVSFGYEDAEGYHIKDSEYIFPDGRYKDIPVVVLVNNSCMSAGDGMAKFLGDCPNVTLMGITSSSGVNQNTGGLIYLTDNITVKYPVFLSLAENGEPLIDTDYTRTNNIPLDVKIPITRESALVIFSLDEEIAKTDYELTYAIEFLDSIYNK